MEKTYTIEQVWNVLWFGIFIGFMIAMIWSALFDWLIEPRLKLVIERLARKIVDRALKGD